MAMMHIVLARAGYLLHTPCRKEPNICINRIDAQQIRGISLGYEVDFFPAAAGGGAAVVVRWGTPGDYRVLVYDGGTLASARLLVQHVREQCLTSHVDYVVSAHPDPKHAEGLELILERLSIGELWMHRPWTHTDRSWKAMAVCRKVEELALARQIPVQEPFAGALVGPFTVLSPNRSWYVEGLLPAFGKAPSPAAGMTLADAARWIRLASGSVGSRWDCEALPRNSAKTSRASCCTASSKAAACCSRAMQASGR